MESKHRWPSLAERLNYGIERRNLVLREDQAVCPFHKRTDLVSMLAASNKGRDLVLIPIKMGRMAMSPFAFFRGTAPLMAADIAPLPITGLDVQLCGDAHVRNLGAFAAPEGHLVFDLNDFDETIPGPWEWDLKRLATSVILAGREAGDSDGECKDAVKTLTSSYRRSLVQFASMRVLELAKYEIRRESSNGVVQKVLLKAERATPAKTLKKLTETGPDSWPQFHGRPPLLDRVPPRVRSAVLGALDPYRKTLSAGRRLIFDAYHPHDVAFKVVGTGSVGTRDYVVLLFGSDADDPMFLQIKEELPSCYSPYLAHLPPFEHEGKRVAQGQQRMQTVSDSFLGWTTMDGVPYLVRQLADHKASIDPEDLKGATLAEYAKVSGKVLAKAHARTGDSVALAGYCGKTGKLDKAIACFATNYADQVTSDFGLFIKAVKAGKIKAASLS